MKQPLAQQQAHPYAQALAGVWHDLGVALGRLEHLAGAPAELPEQEAGRLAALQYRLHAASEAVLALAPPAGAEPEHEELGAALVGARDTTARVVAELEHGAAAASIYEWRGALFRVRLAQQDIKDVQDRDAPVAGRSWKRLQGILLLCVALVALGAGAHASVWPVVAGAVLAVPLALVLLLRP